MKVSWFIFRHKLLLTSVTDSSSTRPESTTEKPLSTTGNFTHFSYFYVKPSDIYGSEAAFNVAFVFLIHDDAMMCRHHYTFHLRATLDRRFFILQGVITYVLNRVRNQKHMARNLGVVQLRAATTYEQTTLDGVQRETINNRAKSTQYGGNLIRILSYSKSVIL